jgi:hypothetical protein
VKLCLGFSDVFILPSFSITESDLHSLIFLANRSCQAAGKNHTNQLEQRQCCCKFTDSSVLKEDKKQLMK